MSEPAHHNRVELCGCVEGFCRGPGGRIRGVWLLVHVQEEALVPVVSEAMPFVQRGDRLFVRGVLATERVPGQPYPMVCVTALTIEILKPRAATANVAPDRRTRDELHRIFATHVENS